LREALRNDASIFTTVPGDRSLLVPGATIFTGAPLAADGKIPTARL
jgi:hypothetical protein